MLLFDLILLLLSNVSDNLTFLFGRGYVLQSCITLCCEHVCIDLEVLLPSLQLVFRSSLSKSNHIVQRFGFLSRSCFLLVQISCSHFCSRRFSSTRLFVYKLLPLKLVNFLSFIVFEIALSQHFVTL